MLSIKAFLGARNVVLSSPGDTMENMVDKVDVRGCVAMSFMLVMALRTPSAQLTNQT